MGGKDLSDSESDSESDSSNDEINASEAESSDAAPTTTIFSSAPVHDQFGGNVVVTTTPGLPSDSDDDATARYKELRKSMARRKNVDVHQRELNTHIPYMKKLEGSLPGKKKSAGKKWSGKGMHGAQGMKGMGGAVGVKAAKKILSRASAKQGGISGTDDGGRGKKGGKRGGKRGRK
uniref:Uncharacterized protein n=1 Tax=Corethron hystrix TaxID=216773 RepID=A0A7S1BBF4_9STRA|mmetsp:Transcript_19337/g.44059  ORF Transcript_19337/g.44059 Transcript_19337/m.44059 type:complete len:177 (+) Transcript_19337:253-783(+)